MPRFSIVVPAYNSHATIRQTLDAILAQSTGDWECVVVNDGSTDETPEIVQEYVDRDPRFVLVNQPNMGAAGAYNSGVAAASAGLLVLCSSDDLLLSAHLATMDSFIAEYPEFDIYSCNGELLFDDSGFRRIVHPVEPWLSVRSLSFLEVIESCFFSVGTVFRREIYDLVGGFRLGAYVEDWDFWLRTMARGARHLYTPAVLVVHRLSASQKSANAVRILQSDIETLKSLTAAEQLSPEGLTAVSCSIRGRKRHIWALRLHAQRRRIAAAARRLFGATLTSRTGRLIDTAAARALRRNPPASKDRDTW